MSTKSLTLQNIAVAEAITTGAADHSLANTNEILTDSPVHQPNYNYSTLCVVASPEAAPVKGRLHRWATVEGLATAVICRDGDNLEITGSAEIYQAIGGVWMRALVDGMVARKRAVLSTPSDTFDLTWSDGSPVGYRLSSPVPNACVAWVVLKKV